MAIHIEEAYGYAVMYDDATGRTAVCYGSGQEVDGVQVMQFVVLSWHETQVEAYEALAVHQLMQEEEGSNDHDSDRADGPAAIER